MSVISRVGPIGFRNAGHVRFKGFDLQNRRKAFLQKSCGESQQLNYDMAKIFRLFRESTDVYLDYEVAIDGKKISVKVINKASGKVIREIRLKTELKMDIPAGVNIYNIV